MCVCVYTTDAKMRINDIEIERVNETGKCLHFNTWCALSEWRHTCAATLTGESDVIGVRTHLGCFPLICPLRSALKGKTKQNRVRELLWYQQLGTQVILQKSDTCSSVYETDLRLKKTQTSLSWQHIHRRDRFELVLEGLKSQRVRKHIWQGLLTTLLSESSTCWSRLRERPRGALLFLEAIIVTHHRSCHCEPATAAESASSIGGSDSRRSDLQDIFELSGFTVGGGYSVSQSWSSTSLVDPELSKPAESPHIKKQAL